MILTKTIRTPVKAKTATGETGEETIGFEGYASVFDNIDLGGDKIVKGAFADTLKERYPDHGKGVPVYWNHETSDPFKNLGMTDTAEEDNHGLKVTGTIDTSTDVGQQVAKLLKEGRVGQMSFAYDVKEGAWVDGKRNDDGSYTPGYYELRNLDLYEVSICPIGMNQSTEVSAKTAVLGLKPDEQPAKQAAEPHDATTTPHLDTADRRLRLLTIQ